jgi:hypothetical protein
MTRHIFLSGRVTAFLIEPDKEPRYLSGFYVNELDIAGKEMTVYGLLPDNLHLAKFPSGARLEFQYREVGKFSDYESYDAFLRLNNCRLVRCWIPEFIPRDPDQKEEALEIWAVIEGDIEVINEKRTESL